MKQRTILTVICYGLWSCTGLVAQIFLAGTVYDARTKEPLSYASIQELSTQTAGQADERGRFRLALPDGAVQERDSLLIEVSYVGYRAERKTVPVGDYATLRFALSAAAELPTVEVRAAADRSAGGSVITPTLATLDATPQLGGERDYLKALTLLPGISTSVEGTANLQIRGGTADQTLLLLDGNPIYYVNHAGGFLSGVPEYGVKAVTVYKGGVPARSGGRLSGVVDLLLREGDRDRWRGEFSLGTVSSRLGFDGPVGQKGSLLLTGRFGYPALALDLIGAAADYEPGRSGDKTNLRAYDGLAKYVWRDQKTRVALSVFNAGDDGLVQDAGPSAVYVERFRWNNLAISLNLDREISARTQWRTALAMSRYAYGYTSAENIVEVDSDRIFTTTEKQRSAISDISLRSEWSHLIDDRQSIDFGVNLTGRSVRSGADVTSNYGTPPLQLLDVVDPALEWAVYAGHRWSALAGRLDIHSGLRVSGLFGNRAGGFGYLFAEPRLRLAYRLNRGLRLNAGYDVHTQYVHQLATSGGALPNDLWLLSNGEMAPGRSGQWYLGLASSGSGSLLQWSAEIFDKRMSDLITVKRRFQPDFQLVGNWEDLVETAGRGRAYGLELALATDPDRRLSAGVAYTLMRSERRFAAVNRGQTYPFTYDRRHDLAVQLTYRLGRKWQLNANWIYQTGHAVSLPAAATPQFFVYPSVNNGRMPAFHRLDLSLSKTWRAKRNSDRTKELTFSLYNAYNRLNPYQLRFDRYSVPFAGDPSGRRREMGIRTEQTSLFPIVPGINYRVAFGR